MTAPSNIRKPHSHALAAASTAAALILAMSGTDVRAADEYTFYVVEPFDKSYPLATSRIGDMDEQGTAVGIAYDEGTFLWDAETGLTAADIGGGEINELGHTAAGSAIYWSEGNYEQLPHPTEPGFVSQIRDLTDNLYACGTAGISERTIGFVWDPANGTRSLESLGVPTITRRGVAINDAGLLVGTTSAAGEPFDEKAFLLDVENEIFTSLHHLLNPSGVGASRPSDINSFGQVCGEGTYGNGAGIAGWFWSESEGFTLLPGMAGGLEMDVHPIGLNDAGDVVGMALDGDWEWQAFLWNETLGMRDLADLTTVPDGFNLEEAKGITNSGTIYGRGFWGSTWGPERAFVMVPIDAAANVDDLEPTVEHDPATLFLPRPNPAIGSDVEISFALATPGPVSLSVFSATGRRVRTLVDGAGAVGLRSVTWNGRDDAGEMTPAGVYFLELRSAGAVRRARMTRVP